MPSTSWRSASVTPPIKLAGRATLRCPHPATGTAASLCRQKTPGRAKDERPAPRRGRGLAWKRRARQRAPLPRTRRPARNVQTSAPRFWRRRRRQHALHQRSTSTFQRARFPPGNFPESWYKGADQALATADVVFKGGAWVRVVSARQSVCAVRSFVTSAAPGHGRARAGHRRCGAAPHKQCAAMQHVATPARRATKAPQR